MFNKCPMKDCTKLSNTNPEVLENYEKLICEVLPHSLSFQTCLVGFESAKLRC